MEKQYREIDAGTPMNAHNFLAELNHHGIMGHARGTIVCILQNHLTAEDHKKIDDVQAHFAVPQEKALTE